MKSIFEQVSSTISYYDRSSEGLYTAYENADMSALHKLLTEQLHHNSKVLDIGFGSGRDLAFIIQKLGCDTWGVDPSVKFVQKAKKRFSSIEGHFFQGLLPNLNLPKNLYGTFDTIIMIAVWMHIPKEFYAESIQKLCSLLKPGGKIIISYSITPRLNETERYFEEVDSKLMQELFYDNQCIKTLETKNDDGLQDRSIIWKTEVYRYDQS